MGRTEEIRDWRGQLVCKANGLEGVIELRTSKSRTVIILPVGGQFAYETETSYTLIERINPREFYVTSYPNYS